jgi:hypothetical protein
MQGQSHNPYTRDGNIENIFIVQKGYSSSRQQPFKETQTNLHTCCNFGQSHGEPIFGLLQKII